MTEFAAALLFPQWQGAGHRKGYAAGTALLETLLPDAFPRAFVHCLDEDLMVGEGVKGLIDLVTQAETAQHLLSQLPPGPILTLGGDCAADFTSIAHANAVHEGDMALVYIDAHADLNAPQESPSGHFHGMVVRCLLGDGPAPLRTLNPRPLSPHQVFYLSARERDPAEVACMSARNIFRLADGADVATLVEALQRRGYRRLYIHLDLDVLDPAAFSYIGVPAPGGWPVAKLIAMLTTFAARFEICGAAITELNLGHNDATAATPILRQILAGIGLD